MIPSKAYTVFLLSFLMLARANAQPIVLQGVVKDAEKREALPFTNVYLKAGNTGAVSNEKGIFKLTIPQDQQNDSLVFSRIGYKSTTIGISNSTAPLEVMLVENEMVLTEVVVTGYTANAIVEKAIASIPDNYNQRPHRSKGFYRVTSQKDNSYIHLSEAVFDMNHALASKPKQQFRLEKMRAIKDERASKGIDLGLKPSGLYEFDVVNNLEGMGLLNKKGLKLHTFKIEGTEVIDGNEAYIISFDQKDVNKPGYKGYMLIDQETFAFIHFNFGLSPKGVSTYKFGDASTRALMKIVGIDISMSKNNYQISYRKFNQRYYLNKVGNDATLTFKSKREHYNFTTDTRVDYILTKIETENIAPFTSEETLGKGKLIEEQHSIYDPYFWKDYNILLSTSDFNAIAKKLEANNRSNNLKLVLEDRLFKLPKDPSLRIDSILSFYNKKDLFNGNALITYQGEILLQKSYNSDITSNKSNSLFRIGSLSKTFTSMVIAQLEEEGKLTFSDTIGQFLPTYPHKHVAIHDLLSHQSGIPDFLDKSDYLTQILINDYSLEEIASKFCSDSLAFEPGNTFEYSNSNYVLLSLIAEKIRNIPYGEILSQYVFNPLDMAETYFGEISSHENLATGFLYGKPEPTYNPQNVGGAGGISSTTEDLLKWSNALDSSKVLPQSKIENLVEPKAEYNDWDAYYGYGWMIDRYMFTSSKWHPIYYHPGTDFGFYSMFLKQPDLGITLILLNNTGEFPRFEIAELILNELN